MGNVARFAALPNGRVKALASDARRGPRVRKTITQTQARVIAAKANAAIAARRATVDAAPVVTILEAAKLGIRPNVPMPGVDVPGVVRVLTVDPGIVHKGYAADGKTAIYGTNNTFVPGETLGRKWLKHARTSQSQVYVPSPDKRADVEGHMVFHRGSHRVGNVPSDLVPDDLRLYARMMRPDC